MDHDAAVQSQAVERYWLGELGATEREEFEEHFFVCPLCAEALNLTEALEANLKAAATDENLRSRPRSFAPWFSTAIAASLLVGVAGFDHLFQIPRYQKEIAVLSQPQVVDPVVLHATERGENSATVIVKKDSPLYYVKFDIAEPSGTGYDCVIQTASGVAIEELKHVQPSSVGELSLRLNAEKTPPGDYVLLLVEPGSRKELRRYPFSVRPEAK